MLLLFIVFFTTLLIGVPIFIALAGSSLVYTNLIAGIPDFVILHRMAGGVDSFPLLAVPFFILAGNLMNSAGITNRIYDFAVALVGWLKGGLGHVNVVGSVIFAGMSGTAVADAGGLGTIEIKAMRDHGYKTDFAVGVTAASATIGPIIPPSLPMVIFGVMANVSIGQLFAAGFIPGLLMAAFLMMYVTWYAHRYNIGRDQVFRLAILRTTFVHALPALMTPAIIIGGMSFGIFTPTEAAVAACMWALFLGLVFYPLTSQLEAVGIPLGRVLSIMTIVLAAACLAAYYDLANPVRVIMGALLLNILGSVAAYVYLTWVGRIVPTYPPMSFKRFFKISMDTIETTAAVLIIVGAASLFGWVLTTARVTEAITEVLLGISRDPLALLLIINVLLLIVGCFMETIAAISILVPVLMPAVVQAGIDPVQFGVIMVLNLMIGLLTPPVGMVLFILARVASISFDRTVRAVLPFLFPLLAVLMLITIFPSLTLIVPQYLYR
ncbi:MAG: ABC transporter permease [Alphaproteobacteria bacterium 64-6]|uniref:TRAP transporter large permease n=1 Tax=Hyphomicrobium sp. CS1BSMeth3 TaxID=1892844 RepID=UPI0009309EEF|nr:TRAP transporter large permease [Hyphomicrobium sp. CS1BSMeth3]OJU23212.1 MAG: ABC transporter permease [Alphaproteobacteria bacterium 64-6]